MSNLMPSAKKPRFIATAVTAALMTLSSPYSFGANGADGSAATPSLNAGGGGGGTMDPVTGLGGNGGAGGLGMGGQGSSSGQAGNPGSINGTPNAVQPGVATGGAGNNGTPGSTNGSGAAGGGGGGGSAGVVVTDNSTHTNSGTIQGGAGGDGGNGGSNSTNNITDAGHGGNGGAGGDGGSGILITAAGTYNNSGSIVGGNGGSGGNTGSATAAADTTSTEIRGGSGGTGGIGGNGVMATQGATITNTGSITGGNGATGGLAANANTTANDAVTGIGGNGGLASRGGNGVLLSDTSSITNSGSIIGGNGGNGGNGGAVVAGNGAGVIGNGAAAGNGGSGISVVGSGTIVNQSNGRIVGGNGGTGGGGNSSSSGQNLSGGDGGMGGNGGSGVRLVNGGSVNNFGAISGGEGNRGGGSGSLVTSRGGDSGAGGIGIEIISAGSVVNEASGTVTGGSGGDDSAGGGGTGGIGGDAVSISGQGTVTNRGRFTGGRGGNGANSNTDGGTGAQGGSGLVIQGQGRVLNDAGATIVGGVGGSGGGGNPNNRGGDGGAGGNAVFISNGGTLTNHGRLAGGDGNRGGGGGGANGGAGGVGVNIESGGGSIINTGTISGGTGGNAGTAGNVNGTGAVGLGGIGVYGHDITIVNSGTLQGGSAFDGSSTAQAVKFTGGVNSLELQAGYRVLGNVEANNSNDTLILGGAVNARFDASSIGDTAQYRGFTAYHKTGRSVWALNNTTSAKTPWTLYAGILQIKQDASLGSADGQLTFNGGTLQMADEFNFDSTRAIVLESAGGTLDTQTFNTTLSQGITGSGGLTKLGTGTLTLTGSSSYTGLTTLAEGSLDVVGSLSGAVLAKSATVLSGSGSVGATTLESGSTLNVGSPTQPDSSASQFTINGGLTNSGTINTGRSAQTAGNKLFVNGNYTGSANSQINLNTVLGDDSSLTDRVYIQADTSGNTLVSVTNVGGKGAHTDQGIEVISVGGASNATFTKNGRIVAGPLEYSLVKKGQNWYLTSLDEGPTTEPPTGGNGGRPVYRPEAGGYLTNHAASNTIFNLTLDDREGATEYSHPLSKRSATASTFWLRQEGGQNRSRTAEEQIRSVANRYVAQMGNEFLHGDYRETGRWGAGLMAGYGNVSGTSRSSINGYKTLSDMDGYSVGAYGTWYQDAVKRTGFYADSWVMYNWFDNRVKGESLPSEHYKSRGVTASIESGYGVLLHESERQSVYLEPQAQLIWMGVKSSTLHEANGTRIQDSGQGNLQSRLGVRLYMRGHRTEDDGKGREFKPYVEADWLHNTHDFGVRMNDTLLTQHGAKNIAQLKLGVQGQINPALNVWSGTAVQIGDSGYSDVSAMVGMKYGF